MTRTQASFPAVYELVRMVPAGQVASYGMIASLLPGVTPRMVGYAMAGVPVGSDIPWQRIINSGGRISPRPGSDRQHERLTAEGISFSASGRIKWAEARWQGPDDGWLDVRGMEMMDYLDIRAGWPR